MKFLLTLVLTLLLATAASAIQLTVLDPLNDPTQIIPQADYGILIASEIQGCTFSEASIASHGDQLVVGSNGLCSDTNHIRLFSSTDAGNTWAPDEEGLRADQIPGYQWDQSADPYVVRAADGQYHASLVGFSNAFATVTPGNGYDCSQPTGVEVASSADGITWSAWHPIHANAGELPDRPMLGTDPVNGTNLFAFFNVYRNGDGPDSECDANHCCSNEGRPALAVSSDHGITWSAPKYLQPTAYQTAVSTPGSFVVVSNAAFVPYWSDPHTITLRRWTGGPPNGVGTQATIDRTPVAGTIGGFVGTDHFFLPGIEQTRLNGSPYIAVAADGSHMVMAWMELHPYSASRSRVIATISNDQGATWSTPVAVSPYREPLFGNLVDNDAFLPMVSWGAQAHVCFYERLQNNSNWVQLRCVYTKNGGTTWKSRVTYLGGSGDQRSYISDHLCHSKVEFLGDYNGWVDGWLAVTALRYNGPNPCNVRPFIRVANFPASVGGCSIQAGGPTMPGVGWLLAAIGLPLILLVRRSTVSVLTLIVAVAAAYLIFFAGFALAQVAHCVGDCDEDGAVQVNELVISVRVLLGDDELSACPAIECGQPWGPQINCMVIAVQSALTACPDTNPNARCGFDCFGPCWSRQPGDPPCPCEPPQACVEQVTQDGVTCNGSFCGLDGCFEQYRATFPERCFTDAPVGVP